MPRLELFVCRHGETTWNRVGRIQGHKNPGLSPLGQSQAEALGEQLRGEEFDRVLSSDLRRCRETTALILKGRDIPLGFTKRLRERRMGVLEGLTWKEAKERYSSIYKADRLREELPPQLKIEHHENDFRPRVLDALHRVEKRYGDSLKRLLVVAHGGVLKVLLSEAEGRGKLFMVPNCALYRFMLEDSKLSLLKNVKSEADFPSSD